MFDSCPDYHCYHPACYNYILLGAEPAVIRRKLLLMIFRVKMWFVMLLTPALSYHKDTAQGTKGHLLGALGRNKGDFHLPCTERDAWRGNIMIPIPTNESTVLMDLDQ